MKRNRNDYVIAWIEPPPYNIGFSWGEDRKHCLYHAPTIRGLIKKVKAALEDMTLTDGRPGPDIGPVKSLDALVEKISECRHLDPDDIGWGRMDDLSWLPTAGYVEGWDPVDVWGGMADYLSYRSFQRLMDRPYDDYCLDGVDLSRANPDILNDALWYLTPEDGAVYTCIMAAIAAGRTSDEKTNISA